MYGLYLLIAVSSLFFLISCLLAVLLYRSRKRPPKRLSDSAEDLLHDLTKRGSAVLRVQVIDPEQIFLRSPKL